MIVPHRAKMPGQTRELYNLGKPNLMTSKGSRPMLWVPRGSVDERGMKEISLRLRNLRTYCMKEFLCPTASSNYPEKCHCKSYCVFAQQAYANVGCEFSRQQRAPKLRHACNECHASKVRAIILGMRVTAHAFWVGQMYWRTYRMSKMCL